MMQRLSILLLCAVLLSACGSSQPIRHYILQPTVVAEGKYISDVVIGIGPVTVAEFLQQAAIATSDDGYRLNYAETEQWGEPLSDGIARTVAENIATLTGSDKVRMFPWRGDEQPDIAIKIEIQNLNASNNLATLRLRWSLRRKGEDQLLAEGYQSYQQQLASMSYTDIAQGYSELLAQLSMDLADRLKNLSAATANEK